MAVCSDSPSTFGTVTCAGPVETNSLTVLPLGTVVPFGGLVLITSPLGTELDARSTGWATRCAFTISFSAVASGSPATSGTAKLLPLPET